MKCFMNCESAEQAVTVLAPHPPDGESSSRSLRKTGGRRDCGPQESHRQGPGGGLRLGRVQRKKRLGPSWAKASPAQVHFLLW